MLLLHLLADGEGALALKHIGGDRGNPLANSIVRSTLKFTALGNRSLVGLHRFGNLSGLRASKSLRDGGNLRSLLQSKREPVLLLFGQFSLVLEGDRSVKEGRGGRDNDTILTDDLYSLLAELESGLEVSLPDVSAGDNTEGKNDVSGLDGGQDVLELSRGTIKIDVETIDGELGDELHVGTKASKVSGKQDLWGDRGKVGVC